MLTIEKKLSIEPSFDLSRIAKRERIVFFDIETTGLSAERAGLYLIGAVHFEDGAWCLTQYFAESFADEEQMLSSFFRLLTRKRRAAAAESGRSANVVLVHYNGDMFDIPFLRRMLQSYRMPYDFTGCLSLDLYKKTKQIKALLELPDCKLKSVERALGIEREDRFSGGELIYVYEEYLRLSHLDPESCEATPQNAALREHLLRTLLLHNEEDMTNLPYICGVLAYDALFQGEMKLCEVHILTSEADPAKPVSVLDLRYELPGPLPKPIYREEAPYVFSVTEKDGAGIVNLAVALFEGELRFFFPDYKNYYYLPAEDCAIHKSVGTFVDAKARRQATAKTCYQRKEGRFLPEPSEIFGPCFYGQYKDKKPYAILTDEMLEHPDEERWQRYACEVLKFLLRKR